MFRKLALSLAVAAGLISQLALPANAALGVGAFAPSAALAEASPVERAQFVWGGRRYCWYNSAWRGPGWYQCGFAWRRGFGWGGAAGWHGWRHPGFVHRPVHQAAGPPSAPSRPREAAGPSPAAGAPPRRQSRRKPAPLSVSEGVARTGYLPIVAQPAAGR